MTLRTVINRRVRTFSSNAVFCLRVVRWCFTGISCFRPTLQWTRLNMSEINLTGRKTQIKKSTAVVITWHQLNGMLTIWFAGDVAWRHHMINRHSSVYEASCSKTVSLGGKCTLNKSYNLTLFKLYFFQPNRDSIRKHFIKNHLHAHGLPFSSTLECLLWNAYFWGEKLKKMQCLGENVT